MPVIMREVALLTLTNSDNLVAGSTFEIARTRQIISVGVVASATGTFITINSGSDVVLERTPPPVKATYPVIPDEMFFTDVMEAGDRLVIAAQNPTGGTITFRVVVQITPV